ncbi:hypothetical protein TcWFU_006168 [Taenia crassiceps]|uniref:Uncharacterized protein n=1 Tax=Taenia crassiceps TaxID=6207 RepID=A0ABR4Q6F1_9CEST
MKSCCKAQLRGHNCARGGNLRALQSSTGNGNESLFSTSQDHRLRSQTLHVICHASCEAEVEDVPTGSFESTLCVNGLAAAAAAICRSIGLNVDSVFTSNGSLIRSSNCPVYIQFPSSLYKALIKSMGKEGDDDETGSGVMSLFRPFYMFLISTMTSFYEHVEVASVSVVKASVVTGGRKPSKAERCMFKKPEIVEGIRLHHSSNWNLPCWDLFGHLRQQRPVKKGKL